MGTSSNEYRAKCAYAARINAVLESLDRIEQGMGTVTDAEFLRGIIAGTADHAGDHFAVKCITERTRATVIPAEPFHGQVIPFVGGDVKVGGTA